jgi:hypothetical protein
MTPLKLISNFTSYGKHVLLPLLLLLCLNSFGQQTKIERIPIGTKTDDYIQITADTSRLAKALRRSLADGTAIYDVTIISNSGHHYLVGYGIKMYYKKIIAVPLEYDMASRQFFAIDNVSHYTCSAAACDDCELFLENGKLIGCHCPEQQSVSNHCTYKRVEVSPFFQHLSQFIRVTR